MKKNDSFLYILSFTLSFFVLNISAQNKQLLWDKIQKEDIKQEKLFRKTVPNKAAFFRLNIEELKQSLKNAPVNFRNDSKPQLIVDLPNNKGELIKYAVFEASVFSADLQQQHPDIRSYKGVSVNDPSKIIRFSVSPAGFHAFLLKTDQGSQFIDPYTKDKSTYIVYSKKDLPQLNEEFLCGFENNLSRPNSTTEKSTQKFNDGNLRTFRLALACTHEYAEFHITNPSGTEEEKKNEVLAAMNTTMTRVNGIYENELSIHLEIIANNKDIIFVDGASDPFTGNNNANTLIGESQTIIDNTIGTANYDIGHTFSTGAGGLASLGVPCVTGSKARGVTGLSSPIGDVYDVDYVSHEMGHQFGANHTFNNECGGQRNNGTAVEPGSGSTIMAYAGICSPNVQNASDDYFHIVSIQEMWNYVTIGAGTCSDQTATGNNSPTITSIPDYNIPPSTPFVLRGNGNDPDGSGSLTYAWEQTDTTPAVMPPESTSVDGPLFRSLDPSSSENRYLPALGTTSDWEVIPSVERDMNFTLTVRDNDLAGGRYATEDIIVHTENVQPFIVTNPVLPVVWGAGTTKTITWDVGSTTNATINSPNVNIKLSTDGGLTYPIVLINNTPNDGTEDVVIPNNLSSTCRIMVESKENIFFNITPVDFTIAPSDGQTEYCESTYTNGPPSEYISNVTFKGINNDTGDAPVNGYEDYTSISTDVELNEVIQLDVEINTAGNFTDNCKVYIDWNNDSVFEVADGELYDLGSVTNVTAGVLSTNVTVPNNAVIGNTRMRVSIEEANGRVVPGPCNSDHLSEWGETEDYTVNIMNSLSVDDENFKMLRIFPNPTKDIVNIMLQMESTSDITVHLFDLLGRQMLKKSFNVKSGIFNEQLEVSSMSAGIYILKITQDDKIVSKELILN